MMARLVPSDTPISISPVMPTSLASGVPESSPVVEKNVAQSGLLVIS